MYKNLTEILNVQVWSQILANLNFGGSVKLHVLEN